jgi:hypothetical protein
MSVVTAYVDNISPASPAAQFVPYDDEHVMAENRNTPKKPANKTSSL